MDDELRGVGGWLAFFIIVMAVISPLVSVFFVYQALYATPMIEYAFGENWQTIQTFEWSLVGVGAMIGWFVAWRLHAVRNWRSVQLAIASVWIAGIGLNLVDLFGVSWISGIPLDMLIPASGVGVIVRPLVFGLVWTSYLLKSERVQNTYRGVEEDVEVFE